MTTALVIGGGVAGPVAAMALQRAGFDAVVCEGRSAPDGSDGAFLTLQVNGIDALRAIDVDVTDRGFASPSIRMRSGSGRVLGEVSTGEPLDDGTTAIALRRADLHAALREEAIRRGVTVEHGRRLVDAVPVDGGVEARFADGTTATAGLLVGADGLHSRVRRIIDPAAAPPRRLSLLNTGGFAPPQPTDARGGSFEMVFGRRAFFGYGVAPDGTVWWFANPPHGDGPLPEPGPAWREHLLDLFAADRSPACAIIASTPGEPPVWTTHDLPSVRHWHRDGMIVVGDAAHATSPSSGQGASLAIEDAVELARCLRDLPTVSDAFAGYEQLRRARVERIVARGARTSNSKVAGPVGRFLRDALLPLALRAGGAAPRWVHHHHIAWDAPAPAR